MRWTKVAFSILMTLMRSVRLLFNQHAGWRKTELCYIGAMHCITIECTCKLPVTVATVTKLGDQLAVDLEDEDAAGLVVDHDDVAVSVHRHAFRTHQLPRADLVLERFIFMKPHVRK